MIDPWCDSFHGFVGGIDRFCFRINFHLDFGREGERAKR
jgi:hypothetical protein